MKRCTSNQRQGPEFWHLRSLTHLKLAAFADLAEPGDAVQIVGGNRLTLLFEEPEGGEREASVVAVAVLVHDRHLVPGTPEKRKKNNRNALAVSVVVDRSSWNGPMTYETNKLKKVLLVGYGEIEA